MSSKKIFFHVKDDNNYCKPYLNIYDSDYEDEYCECSEIDLILPKKKYIVNIIGRNDAFDTKVIIQKEFNKITNAKNFLLQTYSLINKKGPYIITGTTADGYYHVGKHGPSTPITYTKLKKFKVGSTKFNYQIFGIVLKTKGKIIDTLLIKPID